MTIIAWVSLGHVMGVFKLFHGCFKGTSRLCQEYFYVILGYATVVSRVFLACFCPIEFAYICVAEKTSVQKNKLEAFLRHPQTHLEHKADTFES